MSLYLSIFNLVITVGLLPISLIALQFVDGSTLTDEKFLTFWGKLYSNMDYKNHADNITARSYFLIFVIRRMIFIATGFFITERPIFQIMIVIFM